MVAAKLDPKAMKVLGALASQALTQIVGGDGAWSDGKNKLRESVTRDPIDSVVATITGATMLFYLAERRVNPKVKTLADAAVFITTSLSVGYSDIFARTEAGKAVASAVMTVGPSMTAKLFDAPRAADPERDPALQEIADLQRQILARLDALVDATKKG
jgi:voltage-gated potassium channel